MTSDDQSLACDMIEVHGVDAATVARNNARGAALAGQAAPAGEVLDQSAQDHPASSGWQSITGPGGGQPPPGGLATIAGSRP